MKLLFAIALLLPVHDSMHPENNAWLKDLASPLNGVCCDGSDSLRLDAPDWDMVDRHYRVRIEGEWITVPDGAVVPPSLNHDGVARVWPMHKDGHPTARCFLPGSMT